MTKGALFVCLGNICRSPIAEAVFLHIIKERGVSEEWKVDSAGLGGWHSGNMPDPRARATLANHDIQYSNTARQIEPEDYLEYDYIFGMDNNNISGLKRDLPPNSKAKIFLLGDFDPQGEKIIRDPYYVSENCNQFIG
jgi:low molecular weight phosphotyrosine protein phosphatase